MEQRVVRMMAVLGLIMAASLMTSEVYGDGDFFGQAEPSRHVMHIRKLSDSDRLKIELEPVWFHLESTEQKAAGESQQVKRQARQNVRRPVEVFSSLKHLERHQRKDRHVPEPGSTERDGAESFLKDFWQVDRMPSDRAASYELPAKSSSLEQQLEDVDLPACFRRYLHDMYDRNNESVRKLMRCLAQHPEESCNEARRAQRMKSYQRGEEDNFAADNPQQALYERKVIRKRKFSDDSERPRDDPLDTEGLKFEKHFIRSDSDDAGQVFEPVPTEDSESGSNESSASDDDEKEQVNDVRSKTQSSDEPERKEQKYDPREPYRRPPQKYNTKKRHRSSGESDQDCSCEGSDESCEDC